jgi:signal transduction histidine kinase
LGREDSFDAPDQEVVEVGVRPMAMAFSNILILQDIAHRAVQEERVRLARELHDEIGPSLATLGLGLDVAMLDADPAQSSELAMLRSNVEGLVEEVRETVADLRQEERVSLLRHARRLASETEEIKVVVELEERRGPRANLANEATSIMSEAVRNAVRHSGASEIRITGQVDKDLGTLRISDDGSGFDPSVPVENHYGVVGMKERAKKIDAKLTIESAYGVGTSVILEWDLR